MHDTGSFFSLGQSSRSSGSGRSTCSSGSSRRGYSSSSGLCDEQTPVRRRDTVTITTAEIGKVFDAFNTVSAQLKLQGQGLESVKKSLQDLTADLQELKEDRRVLIEKVESLQENSAVDDGKIPPEISADVHLLHNSLSLDKQYKPEQSVLSLHNSSVRHELEEQIVHEDKGYPLKMVKRAVVRYYETKRKIYLQSLPENKQKADRQKEENKLRSRRKRLFNARLKVSNDKEKELLQSLNYDYVSDEENGVGVNKGKWVVRRPIWRSERACVLMERLQQQINNSQREDLRPRVPRVEGVPSERQMPRHNVAWALADTEPASGGEHSVEEEEEDERNNHTPTPEQHSTPVSIAHRSGKGKRKRQHRHTPRSPRRQRHAIQSDSE
ncbi:uncharacterized protein C14orf93-like [Montipora capricornis]|uniref:uncharacterized protein C14orf93-like n=1 Tax=Montipora capricornis TaxID=246305 RepID=UPI0035F1DFEE